MKGDGSLMPYRKNLALLILCVKFTNFYSMPIDTQNFNLAVAASFAEWG